MRILQVNKLYWPHIGGVERVVQQLGEGLVTREHKCDVLACGPTDSTKLQNGVEVHQVRTSFHLSSVPMSVAFPREYRRLAGCNDIVIHHYPNPVGEVSEILHPAKLPIVVLYHSDMVRPKLVKPFYQVESRWFLKKARWIVCTSPQYMATSPLMQRFANRTRVIPLSSDLKFYTPTGPRHPLLLGLRNQGFEVVLYVGRFAYYKGLSHLVRAATLLPDHIRIVLVGSGEEETHLKETVRELSLEERVLFLPPVSDEELPSLYRGADLFVLPSIARSEAFGLVAIEAMACGIPLVTTEIGTGTTFYNVSGVTGLVVPPSDPKALAEAIRQILENETRRVEMGKNAAERANAEFSRNIFLDCWERLLLEEI